MQKERQHVDTFVLSVIAATNAATTTDARPWLTGESVRGKIKVK
jgi:hypothetical protein